MAEQQEKKKPRTREEILDTLVGLSKIGESSHTDALNELNGLLVDEEKRSPDDAWAECWREG